jgi:uncharacterized repeat protein (TIGR03803 family)
MFAPLLSARDYVPLREASQCQNHFGNLSTNSCESDRAIRAKTSLAALCPVPQVRVRFFVGRDGASPYAGLVFDQAGNLYGTTLEGGAEDASVVFKLAPNSKSGWNERVLHTFADHPGAQPFAPLISDVAGNLYGTTEGDGTTTFGSVFEITP